MVTAGKVSSSSQQAVDECLPVKFEEVQDISSEEFREAMKIYAIAFPESKWRPISSIKAMVSSGRLRLIIGRTDDRVVLMSTMYPLKGTPFVLGDYIAVAEEYRGKGISWQFNKEIFRILGDLEFDYLLAEVENPYLDADMTKMRRVNYYRRLGMKELKGIRYILPPYQGTSPMEMILMVLPRKGEGSIDGSTIRDVITRIFSELHGRDEGDRILSAIIKGIPDRVELV